MARLLLLLALSALLAAPALRAQSFEGLGFTAPDGVSADGLVVVGRGTGGAVRWTAAGGIEVIGHLPGASYSIATDVSADGAVVVGLSAGQAFRWTAAGGMQGLGFLPGNEPASSADDVSADGSVVVGGSSYFNSSDDNGSEAFRWEGGVMTGLGDLPGGDFASQATGVSADGAVVTGTGTRLRPMGNSGVQAVRWVGGTIQALPFLPGGEGTISIAHGISADGTVIVGTSIAAGVGGLVYEAARWEGEQVFGLGHLPESSGFSRADAASADGAVIGGDGGAGAGAFLWTEAEGMRNLKQVLQTEYGLNLTGWELRTVRAISDDGTVLVGTATNPIGAEEGWRATLRSVLTVTVTGDEPNDPESQDEGVCDVDRDETGAQCTLRAAIETALADDDEDAVSIGFNIEGEGPHLITLASPLPAIDRPVELDGTAEPDYAPGTADQPSAPSVFISGGGAVERGLVLATDSSLVRGLAFGGFSVAAVEIVQGPGPHRIEESWFGLATSGTEPDANGVGVRINEASGVAVGSVADSLRNVFAGNTTAGIQVVGVGATGVTIQGNWIGLTPDGEAALPNAVGVDAAGVPGLVVEKNTILAGQAGVRLAALDGEPTTGARIVGNVLGLLPSNEIPPSGPSDGFGVLVQHAEGTLVGEATDVPGLAPGNTISGWNTGVLVTGTTSGGAVGTRVAGNLIGLDTTGTAARPNRVGVWVAGAAEDTRVGGWEPGERNVISGSESPSGNGTGIAVTSGDGADATGEPTETVIAGNYIGTDITGVEDMGHQKSGILVGPFPGGTGGVSDVIIGATAAMAPGAPAELRRNVIAFSGEVNVLVDRADAAVEAPVQIVGNWIGLDANGEGGITQSTMGSATPVGVHVQGAARATIGGAGEDGNVISGQRLGVWMDADEGAVVGNRIGTDSEGLERRANLFGVAVSGSFVRVGQMPDGSPLGNVISGNILPGASNDVNDGTGVFVAGREVVALIVAPRTVGARGLALPGTSAELFGRVAARAAGPAVALAPSAQGGTPAEDNVVAHNLIGLNADGTAAVVPTEEVNLSNGVWMTNGAVDTQVYANTIGGQQVGVVIGATGDPAGNAVPSGTRVAGNRIGLAASGGDEAFVANRRVGLGVIGAEGSVIGDGAVEGQGPNRIAGTGADGSGLPPDAQGAPGVFLLHPDDALPGSPAGRHTLRQNLIYGNQGLAITRKLRTAGYGVTPNGPGNTDGSASFDFPDLLQAVDDGSTLAVVGTTNGPMAVEVFADGPCDDSGYGEGRVYLGTVQATDGVFEGVVDAAPSRDWRVAVTGTNVNGTTSEFSPCQSVSAPGEAISLVVGEGETPSVDGPDMTLTVTENPAGRTTSRQSAGNLFLGLHQSTPDAGAFAGSAMSDDGTTVTPNGVQEQRFWSVLSDSLDGIVYEACLRYDGLSGVPVPEQLLLVTRGGRGEPWAPHDSFLRPEAGGEDYLCAEGLGVFGEFGIGLDTTSSAVTVVVQPTAPPVIIPVSGGSFQYTLTITNTTAGDMTFDLWSVITGPVTIDPLKDPREVRIGAGNTIQRTLLQNVPARAPAGTYTYTTNVGTFPGTIIDSDSFTFEKEAPPLAGRSGAPARAGMQTSTAVRRGPLSEAELAEWAIDWDASEWVVTATRGSDLPERAVEGAVAGAEPASSSVMEGLPTVFALHAASPNPFARQTTLRYDLLEAAAVGLVVYDVLGREVVVLVDEELEAGSHTTVLNAGRLPTGTYLVRLTAGRFRQTQRVTLLR